MKWISKLGYIIILIGIAFLFEWKVVFPLSNVSNIQNLVPGYVCDNQCNLVISQKRNDILINVYSTNKDTVYITEFTKINLFDMYYLSETKKYEAKSNMIYEVASSILYNYPYAIDIENNKLIISNPKFKWGIVLYSTYSITFGLLVILAGKRYVNEKNIK